MKRIIIGLAGKKHSGKTTAAKHLEKSGFVCLSFAHVLRSMLMPLLLGLGYSAHNVAQLISEDKEQIIEPIGKSFRHLIQTLGTDWGRDLIHPDLWVTVARNQIYIRGERNIVFDDVRFENEAQMIRDLGGLIIHIDRDLPETDSHASEAGIIDNPLDTNIDNNDSLEFFLVEFSLIISRLIRS